MTATIVWGVLADADGLCRWRRFEGEMVDGSLRARRSEEWANNPADDYADSHPGKVSLRWRHSEEVGQVVALRRQHGKLLAVCESDLTPDALQRLTDQHGCLRFSAGTSQTGRQPLTIREVSLTPTPASVGLPEVSWHHPRTSRGNLPSWVRDDLNRRRPSIEVLERESEQGAVVSHSLADERFDPRQVHIAAVAGRILAVNGRPPR